MDDDTGCGTRYEYTLDGTQILLETVYDVTPTSETESYIVVYLYDENGAPVGMKYRTPSYTESQFDTYFFEKNLQGDVVAVYDDAGAKLCTFKYDAWGNATISYESGLNSVTKRFLNSHCVFRYRGYYYDTETGFYYLQSRYYNPTWGRFINADGHINANGDIIGYNMFAYCGNNPVMYTDPTGEIAISVLIAIGIGALLGGIYGGVSAAANEQNVLAGIAIGAVTGGLTGWITEVASIPLMIAGTFAVGFAGDVASQMILDEKKFNDVNLLSASWAGATNAGLSFMGKGLSKIDKMAGMSNSTSIIFGLMTNSPILALGMSINMLISENSPVYSLNDLIEGAFGSGKQLEWKR